MEPTHRLAAPEPPALAPPPRRRMPTERRALTHKFCVAGHEGHLTAGLCTVGELFITASRTGRRAALPPSGQWKRTR